jgi:prepilin-type N-terminal cleavage/methylation domain-containing protein/prepilin-type processing-associated H-X9-DG protein
MFIPDNHWNRRRDFQDRPNRRSAGFTLVELLVVITVIGILIGLTLPAVQAAIEASRRISCANNIHQIAIATTQYETSLRQYPLNWGIVPSGNAGTSAASGPPGSTGTPTTGTGTATVGASWLASLLPYLDNRPLYDQLKLGQALGYQDANGYNNPAVLETAVSTFLCPSDTQRGFIGNQLLDSTPSNNLLYATTNYKGCAGSNWVISFTATSGTSSTPTTGLVGRNANGLDGVDHGNGVVCRGGSTAGIAPTPTANQDVRDGTSKTFLVGEAVPAWCGWSLWLWFDGSTATCGIPLNYSMPGKTPESLASSWQVSYGFASRHKQGANFAACDGSVHYITNTIDLQVYQALATIDGNEATTADGSAVAWP